MFFRTGDFLEKVPYAYLNWIFAGCALLNYLIVMAYNEYEAKFYKKLLRTRKVRDIVVEYTN